MNSPEHIGKRLHFSHAFCGSTRPYYISTKVLTQSNALCVQVENGLDDVFFLHFLVSIQFDISRYLWSTLVATQLFKSSIGGM